MKKICNNCKEEKNIYGLGFCRKCYEKQHYQICKEKILEENKKWYYNNLEKIKIYDKTRYANNKEKILERNKKWRENNKEYTKNRENYDIIFKLRNYLSNRLKLAIKNQGTNKSKKTIELLGCSIQECRQYLEKQFKTGMAWDNYGRWHIDHIIPCVYFLLTDIEQQKLCFHYTNLQPLWAEENLSKGYRIEE